MIYKSNYWKGDEWVCTGHAPSVKIPKELYNCWYCGSVRPKTQLEIIRLKNKVKKEVLCPSAEDSLPACAWFQCDKGENGPLPRRKNSKYCSLDCKNRNARYNYKQRKLLKKAV